MAKGDLISRSELLKEFDPNGDRLDPIFVRSRIVQARSISDAEIRAKAIDEFAERIKKIYPFTILELEQLDEIAEKMRGAE